MKHGIAYSRIILTIILVTSSLCKLANAESNLTLGVHPFLSNAELIKKFTPLANYLSSKMGVDIKVRVGSSYQEHIQYIGLDKIDIAYMGPASYIELTDQYGNKPILARLEVNGLPYFKGNIITRKDSEIQTLNDLKGKRIAFGDRNSTMSYIVPHYMLHQAGVFTDQSTKHQFLNSHSNVALAVLSGDFDAGAVKPAVTKKFEAQGLRILSITPEISEHLFVTRANLPAQKIEQLRNTMLNMNKSTEGLNALRAIKKSITGLVEASDRDYDNLRTIILESKKHH